MAFTPTIIALPGILGASVGFVLAWMVYSARPRRAQNRFLAISLALESAAFGTGTALMYITDDPRVAYGWQMACFVAFVPLPALELLVLSTLASPLSRPLRHPLARGTLVACAVLAPILVLVRPEWFVVGMVPGAFSPWEAAVGPAFTILSAILLVAFLLVIIAALLAASATPGGGAERGKARAFAAAFSVRSLVPASLLLAVGGYIPLSSTAALLAFSVVPPIVHVVFTITLAYAILRTQLFDIELRAKWTVRRGSLAGIFVAVFFVASEGAQLFFEARLGTVFGLAVSGALVFALAPLQRLADRIADTAMPRVADTPAYREARRRDIYRAAIESAMEDGVVTDRERSVLATLADELGISAREALELEREASAARQPAGG